ncbi:MAG: hypothetical protein U1F83_09330 [Verrucomicrobiota bacterium]
MRIVTAIGLLLAASVGLFAQSVPRTPVLRSASGQFIILDHRGAAPPALPGSAKAKGFYDLEPAFLAVSCERLKNGLNSELGAPSQWRGKINVTISPVRNNSEDYAIVVDRFRDGWNYQVNLPQRVERTMFIRTLVQVLLLELANRQAGEHSAEIPFWLVEGLTQRLLVAREAELILTPPDQLIGGISVGPTVIQQRDNDPLETARRILRDRPPMTLEELSSPPTEEFNGTAGEIYRCSAQLFVSELLRLENGRESLRATVTSLGGCYNWQTAFLKSFQARFPNQLALEKWWALQAVYFVGRDPYQLWTSDESWHKLDEVLHTPVAIRRTSGEMPAYAEVTLQVIIREWDTLQQLTALRAKLRELELTRTRVAFEFISVTDDYLRVLKPYVQQRERTPAIYANLQAMPEGTRKVALAVIRQLDALDANRQSMRPRAADSWSAVPPPSPTITR